MAQHYAGPPTDLITQVAMRVTRLQARGWQLSSMVLVSNGTRRRAHRGRALDLGARAARAPRRSGGGGFMLSVDAYLGLRAEHNLTALATSLEPTALASRVELRLESAGQPPRVGAVARALTA